jgi:hypothetical protein
LPVQRLRGAAVDGDKRQDAVSQLIIHVLLLDLLISIRIPWLERRNLQMQL